MTAYRLRELIQGDELTDRETEALLGAALGETAAETGARVYLAGETVRTHRKRATAKLGARNITHAVALAIGTGAVNVLDVLGEPE